MHFLKTHINNKYILSFILSFLIAFLSWYQSCLLVDINKNIDSESIAISINSSQMKSFGFTSMITLLYFFQNISMYK